MNSAIARENENENVGNAVTIGHHRSDTEPTFDLLDGCGLPIHTPSATTKPHESH